MATALDIIKKALLRINAIGKNQEPNATDAKDALYSLNLILNDYLARGCGEINPPLAGLSDTMTTQVRYEMALIDVLAERLRPEYGMAADPVMSQAAARADRLLLKHFVTRGTFGVDSALLPSRMSAHSG